MTQTLTKTALVTGASAGIGQEYAHILAENGYDIVLTARREERLREFAQELEKAYNIKTHCFAYDLSRVGTPKKLAADIAKAGLDIDFLLNNAGYAVPGKFDKTRWKAQQDLLHVMLTAPTELAHIFGKQMQARGGGYIVNVASVAGLLPGVPYATLYGPIKSYMIKFSQALYAEYAPANVHVQALCPGFVLSEFHDVVGNRKAMNRLPKFMWVDRNYLCRESYRRVLKNDNPIIVPGAFYKMLTGLVKLLPQKLSLNILSRQNRNAISP